MQNEEFLIKNACYSPAKYYLCKHNNKRSLLGRKQRSQVVRSFLNRYQFSCISKVTSLFSIRYTLINIFISDEQQKIYFTIASFIDLIINLASSSLIIGPEGRQRPVLKSSSLMPLM